MKNTFSKEIKDNLLKLLYTDEQKLIEELKKHSAQRKEYPEQGEEYFKYAWKPRGCEGKSYYVSNYGHVMLTDEISNKEKISKEYLDKNKQKYWEVKTYNGYLTKEGLPENWNIALYTDVYLFVAEAFKEEFSEELNKLKYKFKNERLELHHINNNPDDNNLSNLIYLPKSIHAYAHKYID